MECEPQRSHLSPPIVHVEVSTPLVVSVQEGYARWAHIYNDDDNPLIALETPRVQQLLGDVRGITVADIGCGMGRHAVTMAAAGAQVTALDFSTSMLAKAQAKPGAAIVRFLRHDLTQGLPFRSETSDGAPWSGANRLRPAMLRDEALTDRVGLDWLGGEPGRTVQDQATVGVSSRHRIAVEPIAAAV
jgi:Methyltransferase domain